MGELLFSELTELVVGFSGENRRLAGFREDVAEVDRREAGSGWGGFGYQPRYIIVAVTDECALTRGW
jgi:hypothetical protein